MWCRMPRCAAAVNQRPSRPRRVAHILTVTLRFSPRFGSAPVKLALASSKALTREFAGPSHNSAVEGSISNRHTLGSLGPPGHHTSSVFRHDALWVSVEAMELTAYQAYVAQLWKQLGG